MSVMTFDFRSQTETAQESAPEARTWHRACPLDELEESFGEAALIGGAQVALIRTGASQVYAVGQADPATSACVMSRGIVGSRGFRPTIASPLHKEVYDLQTGECYGSDGLRLPVYGTRLVDGFVEVAL